MNFDVMAATAAEACAGLKARPYDGERKSEDRRMNEQSNSAD
jgi:hypothetical protein